VPRERFVPAGRIAEAYDDAPVAIEAGQTVSQPYIVAAMIEAAGVGAAARVLEIGAGSGYAAAILSRIARAVVAVERHAALVTLAAGRMRALGCANVEIVAGDGVRGWPAAAPYDAIIVSAAATSVPAALRDQLAVGGTLVIPVGPPDGPAQRLLRVKRRDAAAFVADDRGPVRFVPLVGG
jgi:protein-L-isoaspartate(D-aspartate) O-methyltransferase